MTKGPNMAAKKSAKKLTSTDKTLLKLASKKLETSGLTLEDGVQCGFELLTQSQTNKLSKTFKPARSLKLNYYGPDKKPLADHPNSDNFFRIRYLEETNDFSDLAKKKAVRYTQLPNTAPVAYYPLNQDWSGIVGDADQPIIITEGELKANKACKEGFPTIGLGGVYNWKSPKIGITWLSSLELVNWIKRNVYVCFDSDYLTNPMVCAALRDLAEALHNRGAFVHLVTLPQLQGLDKVGLDDFLTFAGPSANQMFLDLLESAEPLGLTAPLWALNDKYVYVQNPGLIIDQSTHFKVTPGAFKEHLQAPLTYQERTVKKDGGISYKTVSAAAAWLKWPLRKEVVKFTYKPGAESFYNDPHPMFNVWPGWGTEPKKGSVKPFIDLIDHLFTGAEPEAKKWFLQWCACPLQNPGIKMFSSAVIHGIKHGTGKSLVGYTLGEIYGENFTEITQEALHSSYNEWAENKQFVMGDDITGSNKRQDADFLKNLITQKQLRINPKYIPSYVVPACINYLFTANQPDAFFLEDNDRRFFIHEVKASPLDNEFYRAYDNWLYEEGGASAVFHYLLNLDLTDFDPKAPAFRTAAKMRMIDNGRSDLASWVRELIETPDHILRVGDIAVTKDLFTSQELLQFYDPTGRTGTTANGLGRELSRAGVEKVTNGRPVRLSDGSQGRYYIIRNVEKWLKVSAPKKAAEHVEQWELRQKSVKKY